jgi:6-phosphogluconolactonase (cycloisomerase 2 family)
VGDDGLLSEPEWASSGGIRPRFIDIHEGALVCANERSSSVALLALDARPFSGAPPRRVAETGSPVCVLFR